MCGNTYEQNGFSFPNMQVPEEANGFLSRFNFFSSNVEQGELPDLVSTLARTNEILLRQNPNDQHLINMKSLLDAADGKSTKNFPYNQWIDYFNNSQFAGAPVNTACLREIKEQDAPRHFTTFFGKQFMTNVSTFGGLLKSKSTDAAKSLSDDTKIKVAGVILAAWVLGLTSVTGVALKVAAVVGAAATAMTCFQWLKGYSNRNATNTKQHEKIVTLTTQLDTQLKEYINKAGIDANYPAEPQAKPV